MTNGPEVRYRVRGGNPLHGTVFVQGAKNAALKMIAASLLADTGRTVLRNVPPIEDVRRAVELAQAVGAKVEFHEPERTLVVDASQLTSPVLPAEVARKFRGSVLFVPALLHRLGEVVIEGRQHRARARGAGRYFVPEQDGCADHRGRHGFHHGPGR